ncbi:HP1 and insulator partner protein 1 [Anticarsia gemmatalis]|uniref:HP1 and insulator partner protein 1 n=1 Tax=Anticarsia gemmatalis TaxID=129554 RepID=UPI003F761D0C
MEAVEEPPLNNPSVDTVKITVTCDESDENVVSSIEMDVCHKSNGVSELPETTEASAVETKIINAEESKSEAAKNNAEVAEVVVQTDNNMIEQEESPSLEPETASVQTTETTTIMETIVNVEESSPDTGEALKGDDKEISKEGASDDVKTEDPVVEVESIVESTVDRVTFQTEILIESNDSDIIETVGDENKIDEQNTNILSELGESIELSEALRSSNVPDNAENNNCAARQEVFNKEELLDILEGNNEDHPVIQIAVPHKSLHNDKMLEAQVALQQLSRLKKKARKSRIIEKFPRAKRSEKKMIKVETITEPIPEVKIAEKVSTPELKSEENIVSDLVKEWDDEEGVEADKSNKQLDESEDLSKSSNEVVKQDEDSVRTSIDSQSTDGNTATNKSNDESQPQRRHGRVIKKKVIFDPDNPDTFTKSKIIMKSKEQGQEKDLPAKKIKLEQTLLSPLTTSKSPLTKLQWKKPSSTKNSKQNKRLTEVDKLLMDEGAVNMIYQLTPEAPKGKKNMKTKAEFIKKIQSSSTPDTKEMKFRERKKECRYEEGEARKILCGKQRSSIGGSVKSPSVSEDFEAHSADDSIIYRRHSSSSYSSSCMSPRRLSDVEMSSQSSSRNAQQDVQNLTNDEVSIDRPTVDMFMSGSPEVTRTETINKDDCLSIKEKLNSKLNLALNKRKRENSKVDKPPKQKKVIKVDENILISKDFKYLTVRFDAKLAVVCVQKPGSICNIEVLKELENALKFIESKKDISVTLFMPECGITCSDLDLRPLLDDNMEKRTNYAYELAEAVRCVLQAVEQHSKLLCTAASGRCSGVGLALVALSDVALASERTSFAISAKSHTPAPIEPGVGVLTAHRHFSRQVLNDLLVLGRRLPAAEALQCGLVSRVLWPEKYNEQVLTVAKDIAAQPAENIRMKKQLLRLNKSDSELTFLTRLEKERDLFVEYWTSVEGQELLRAIHITA